MKTVSGNLKIKNLLCFLILTLVLLNLFGLWTITPVNAQVEPKLFVEPKDNIYSTTEKGVGDTITINVTVANITGLFGVQFELKWNSTLLKGVSMEEVLYTTLTPEGEEDNIWKLAHKVADDHVEYSYTYMDADRAVAGGYAPFNITVEDGFPEGKMTVAIITLEILAEPPPEGFLECDLEIYHNILGDIGANEIPHEAINGYYKLTAPPRPIPVLKVEPSVYEATRRNEAFKVNVTINDLDAGWEVVGVEFKLRYNTTYLEFVNVTEGPFMKAFAGPPNQGTLFMTYLGDDYVRVGVVILADENGTWHEPFPSGNGTIATLTFNVTSGPPVTCALELYDIMVADWQTNLIDYTKEDGVFKFSSETLYHHIVVYDHPFTVVTTSNATISPVECLPRYRMLTFNATGKSGALLFVNITIPNDLIWLENPEDEWLVLVGGLKVTPAVGGNTTHTWLYFTFITDHKSIYIAGTAVYPEFSSLTILLLIMTVSTVVLLYYKKKRAFLTVKNKQFS